MALTKPSIPLEALPSHMHLAFHYPVWPKPLSASAFVFPLRASINQEAATAKIGPLINPPIHEAIVTRWVTFGFA